MANLQFQTPNSFTEKGSERIRIILEEAKNTLVDEGFSGLSFRNVAKRAGITVGNVTYYFPTKDDLLVELAGYIFDRWEARFRRDLPSDLTDKMEIFLYSIRYMIEENKRVKSNRLLLEMWAMANHSTTCDEDAGRLLLQNARVDRGHAGRYCACPISSKTLAACSANYLPD